MNIIYTHIYHKRKHLETITIIIWKYINCRNVNKKIYIQKEIFTSMNYLNWLGSQSLRKKDYSDAIDIFTINSKLFPKSGNAFDSLGEGYKAAGKNTLAISSFKKSLSLNPPQNVKDNSIKHLKDLGVEIN